VTATLPSIDDLRGLGADVTVGEVPRVECPWCAMEDAYTTVRVTGEPPEHIVTPIDGDVLICRRCAPEVIGRAVAEQDQRSRRPIPVEVDLCP
jgi:hypothetical protein